MTIRQPVEVIILAGGLGSRLRSVVSDVPKPMAPVNGRPFLAYIMDYWILQGAKRFVLSIGYLGDLIVDYFGSEYRGCLVEYVLEDEPLGTGGGVRQVLLKTSWTNSHVILVNGDTWFEVDINQFVTDANRTRLPLTMALKPLAENDRYGSVRIDENSKVTEFSSARSGPCLINAGCYILDVASTTAYLTDFPDRFSFEQDVLVPLAASDAIAGSVQDANFLDIGIPTDYQRVENVLGWSKMNIELVLETNLNDSIKAKQDLIKSPAVRDVFCSAVRHVIECYKSGGRLYIAGNGGSAADAQHLATEFVSKLARDRHPLPAEALTTDSSMITAIGNDYGFDKVFSRQLAGKLQKNDVFLGITTSGQSENVVKALEQCRLSGVKSIVFSGRDGGATKALADFCIVVPGTRTSAIQELHIVLAHTLCECVENAIFPQ